MQLLTVLHVGHGAECVRRGGFQPSMRLTMQGPDFVFRGGSEKGEGEIGREKESV